MYFMAGGGGRERGVNGSAKSPRIPATEFFARFFLRQLPIGAPHPPHPHVPPSFLPRQPGSTTWPRYLRCMDCSRPRTVTCGALLRWTGGMEGHTPAPMRESSWQGVGCLILAADGVGACTEQALAESGHGNVCPCAAGMTEQDIGTSPRDACHLRRTG